jgi:hypothetical protein
MSTPTTAAATSADRDRERGMQERLPEGSNHSGSMRTNSIDGNSTHSHHERERNKDLTGGSEQDYNYNDNDGSDIDVDCPPLRMHATRVPQRLSGSGSHSNLSIPLGLGSPAIHKTTPSAGGGSLGGGGGGGSGSGTGTPRSRSRSPSLNDRTTASTHLMGQGHNHDANSSISSLDDIVDLDILTDRAGFIELDLSESQRKMHLSRENVSNLPSVNERMSEDALEDVHAFSDVARSSNASRANSIGTGGGAVLEPLSEYDDEDLDDLDDIQEEGDHYHHEGGGHGGTTNPQPQVILTNMENLTLQLSQQQADGGAGRAGTRGTGGGSLPSSTPTA